MKDEEKIKEQEQLKAKVEAIRRVIAGLDKVETERKELEHLTLTLFAIRNEV